MQVLEKRSGFQDSFRQTSEWFVRYHKYFLILMLAWTIVCLFVLPATGQDFFDDPASFSLENLKNIDEFWDNLWQQTFNNDATVDNVTIQSFSSIARLFLTFGFPLYAIAIGKLGYEAAGGASLNQLSPSTVKLFISGVLVVMLLGNNAGFLGDLVLEARQLFQGVRNFVLEASVIEVKLRDAVADQVILEQIKSELYADLEICRAMPHAPVDPSAERAIGLGLAAPGELELSEGQNQLNQYFDCLESITEKVEAVRNERAPALCQATGGACKSVTSFLDKFDESFGQAFRNEASKLAKGELPNPLAPGLTVVDVFWGTAAWTSLKPILSAVQIFYSFGLELSLWLSALIAPFMVVLILVPPLFGAAITWAVTIIAIGINQLVYAVLIGMMAVGIESIGGIGLSEIWFYFFVSLGAPVISSSIVFLGASRAASALIGQGLAVGAAIAGLAISGGGSAARLAGGAAASRGGSQSPATQTRLVSKAPPSQST